MAIAMGNKKYKRRTGGGRKVVGVVWKRKAGKSIRTSDMMRKGRFSLFKKRK